MTNTERHERIDFLYAHAERESREINDAELAEIERLSSEMYDEAHRWLDQKLPLSQAA